MITLIVIILILCVLNLLSIIMIGALVVRNTEGIGDLYSILTSMPPPEPPKGRRFGPDDGLVDVGNTEFVQET